MMIECPACSKTDHKTFLGCKDEVEIWQCPEEECRQRIKLTHSLEKEWEIYE